MTREEAIQIIRETYHTDEEKKALESLIPELRESEDERIRKSLIELVEQFMADERKEKTLAYLDALRITIRPDGSIERHTIGYLEKQKAPEGLHPEEYPLTPDECVKPVEWSEKDKEMLMRCIAAIPVQGDEIMPTSYLNKLRNWLKSLPERFNLQPKPEWSEEDKQWLSEVYFAIDHSMYSEVEKQAMKKYIDYLRYQSQQKTTWNDEDSDNLERVDNYLWLLDNYIGDDCATPQGKADKIRENIQKVLSPWIKSLPERFNLQQKQELDEDERIRHALIEFLREAYSRGNAPEECAKWIVWLDRPKEQKPCEDSGTEGDIMQYIEEGEKRGVKEVISFPEKYGLQKKQKPAEWGDEDEKKIHFLSRLIEFQVKDGEYCFGEGSCAISKQEAIEMLQSLRPSWKPSEELLDALYVVANLPELEFYGGLKDKIHELYKQLKKL